MIVTGLYNEMHSSCSWRAIFHCGSRASLSCTFRFCIIFNTFDKTLLSSTGCCTRAKPGTWWWKTLSRVVSVCSLPIHQCAVRSDSSHLGR